MKLAEVTDQDFLFKLNSDATPAMREVTDPDLLAKLNAGQDKGYLDKAARLAEKYIIGPVESARLPEVAGGLLQGVAGGVTSAVNLPLMLASKISGREVRLPYPNLMQYGRQDPGSRAAFIGGELAGSLVPGTAAYKALQGALGKVVNPSLITEAVAGAGAGGLVGGSDDERSRILSAALGGAIPVATSLLPGVMSKRILQKEKALEGKYAKEYGNVFRKIDSLGPEGAEVADLPMLKSGQSRSKVYKALSGDRLSDYRESLAKFEFEPTFENAHNAQSDLRKAANVLGKKIGKLKASNEDVPSKLVKDQQMISKLREQLKAEMDKFLKTMKSPELAEKYKAVSKGYGKELGPFKEIPTYKLRRKEIYPMKFLQEALSNPRFTAPKGPSQQIPGMEVYRYIKENPLLGSLLGGAALGAGYGVAKEFGVPEIANLINKFRM